MHNGAYFFWQAARRAACGAASGDGFEANGFDDVGGGAFGVRRPLRFMAHKLDLSEAQVTALAQLLNALKTERAQAAVDDRRTTAAFADALSGDAFDAKKAAEAADLRVRSAERLRDAVLRTLEQTHALLSAEQRRQLAYLIRTGTLTI